VLFIRASYVRVLLSTKGILALIFAETFLTHLCSTSGLQQLGQPVTLFKDSSLVVAADLNPKECKIQVGFETAS
jgi:hypothetical protein